MLEQFILELFTEFAELWQFTESTGILQFSSDSVHGKIQKFDKRRINSSEFCLAPY